MGSPDIYREMSRLAEEGVPFVLVTVVESAGSTPRKAGAKMIVLSDGRTIDTIGGGKIELQATQDAVEALKKGSSKLVEYELRQSGEHALGMVCGGETKVFLEVHVPASTLLVLGAGHIAQKLAPMASLLDFRVVVLDSREDFATRERFPLADRVVVGHPKDTADLVPIDRSTHIVIVTHGHMHDKDALRAVATGQAAYIGMIGSRSKVRTVLRELEEEGVPADVLARVHAPVGLDIGGHTPGEVALSILAEIIAERHGKVRVAGALRSLVEGPGSTLPVAAGDGTEAAEVSSAG